MFGWEDASGSFKVCQQGGLIHWAMGSRTVFSWNLDFGEEKSYRACVHFMKQTVNSENEVNTTSNEQLRFPYLSCIFVKEACYLGAIT